MADDALPDLLSRFGLSDKEVDTYLALLEHGEAKASTIAEDANVSKRYVYSVSEELENKGFVEVNSHVVPTTIRAYPPDEVIEELQSDIEAMRPALTELYAEPEPTSEQIEVVKSKITILKRMQQLIRDAEEEITLSIPANYLDKLTDVLRDAVDRGVLVVLIVTNYDGERSLDGLASIARSYDAMMPTILAVDSERGVFAPTEMLFRSDVDRQGIVFVQEQLAPVIVGSFFGNYWPISTEVVVAAADPLPATYDNLRHAALHGTLHQRDDVALTASVSGRWTGDAEPVEIQGEVIEIVQGLVKPSNNEFPVEHSLLLETDDGTVSVGGAGAFIEDIEADRVTLDES